MQFINGGSLQDMLKRRGRLTWEQAIHVGRQVCSALEHAHNAGIIHRDLKPANLFLSTKGRLLLGDFGIARDTEATALTAAGKTVGTYAYMAPEQINGAHPISGKTDLYALGCLLYETLVGETPFVSENPAEMLMQHLNDDPHNVSEFAPDCPVWLDNLIDRMLAKDPDDRPYDALAVHTELGEIREKLAEGNSVATTATAPAGQIATRADKDQLRHTIGKKKKKKKKKDVPLHEQTWFLATCLAALLGLTVWLMLPPSVASLHAEAATAMESGDSTARRQALDAFILPILERDPDGPYAADALIWADTVRLEILERQLSNKAKGLGKKSGGRLEMAYLAALSDEDDPDVNPLVAIERYHTVVENLKNFTPEVLESDGPPDGLTDDEFRIWKALFGKRLDEARQRVLQNVQLREFFQARMEQAEQLNADGQYDHASAIWDATATVYLNVDRVADYQRYAQRRRNGHIADIPPAAADAETPDAALQESADRLPDEFSER